MKERADKSARGSISFDARLPISEVDSAEGVVKATEIAPKARNMNALSQRANVSIWQGSASFRDPPRLIRIAHTVKTVTAVKNNTVKTIAVTLPVSKCLMLVS